MAGCSGDSASPFVRGAVASALIVLLLVASGTFPAAAQSILIRAGHASGVTTGAPGGLVEVPLWLALSSAGDVNVASASAVLRWDPDQLEYLAADPGAFGSLTINDSDAGAGVLRLGTYATHGTAASVLLATIRFRVASGVGGLDMAAGVPVHVEITALGKEDGASAAGVAAAAGCSVCVADRLGDVNGDGAVDIIDAQQIARHVVALSVTDELRFPYFADVTADAAANIVDAQQIARCAVGVDVAGDWCAAEPCADLFTADALVLAPGGLILEPGESGATTARVRLGGSPASWPPAAAAAWGLINTTGAIEATSFGDSVLELDAVEDGQARVTARLGPTLAPLSTVQVGAAATSEFHLEIRYLGAATNEQKVAIQAAADRWMQVIIGDVPAHPFTAPSNPGHCPSHPAVDETIDDLVLFVELVEIDGVGGVLGSAGPCYYRTADGLPITGVVNLDSDDVQAMIDNGSFQDVIAHEIGHVLGFGTLWTIDNHDLLAGEGGSDPFFTGVRALDAFLQIGGGSYGGNHVPVENTGGAGTRDGHWRETVFENELMTGWINSGGNPLSIVTVASFQDLGYVVDYSTADAFAIGALAFTGDPTTRRRLEERLLTSPLPVASDGHPHPSRSPR